MAAEDYIDYNYDLDELFEPTVQRSKPKFKGRFAQKIDGLFIEDHHFIGYCEIIRETENSILCRFIDDEVEDSSPKVGIRPWSQRSLRWIPRSQIADQTRSQEPDSLSLNPLSTSGTTGNLWISGWLRERWNEEGVQL